MRLDQTARSVFLTEFVSAFFLSLRYFFKPKSPSSEDMPAPPTAWIASSTPATPQAVWVELKSANWSWDAEGCAMRSLPVNYLLIMSVLPRIYRLFGDIGHGTVVASSYS